MKNRKTRSCAILSLMLAALLLSGCGKAPMPLPEEDFSQSSEFNTVLKPTAEANEAESIIAADAFGSNDTGAESENEYNPLEPLQYSLQNQLDKSTDKWDLWVEDLSTGDYIHCIGNIAGNTPMVSASLIKMFIMGAVYDRIDKGILEEAELWDQLYYMITVSDNASANELTGILGDGSADKGRQAVELWAASVGCPDVRYNRLMLEFNGTENYVSAASCAELLRQIYFGRCVSEYASEQMLSLLKQQTVNDRIPSGITDAVIAHKTGNLYGICVADVGIVCSDRDYLICAICNDPASDNVAAEMISSISCKVSAFFKEIYA